MRKLKGLIGFLALAILVSTANAQITIVIDNQEIPTSDIESITILPNSNLISIVTNIPYTVEPDAEPPPPDSVAINSFTVSPTTILEGESTTVSWVTSNATSCTASGGAGGWDTTSITLDSGSTNITVNNAGTYSFVLTCQGESGPVNRSRTLIVNEDIPPPDPSDCDNPTLSGSTMDWAELWNSDFPGPGYSIRNLSIGRNGYMALEFNTGSIVDYGILSSTGNTITSGTRLGAISECPGDFEVANDCSQVWGSGGGITWRAGGTADCQLEPNTTYYFNVTFTDGSDPNSSTCTSSQCVATLKHFNR